MVVIWWRNIGEMIVKWGRWMNDEWGMVNGWWTVGVKNGMPVLPIA